MSTGSGAGAGGGAHMGDGAKSGLGTVTDGGAWMMIGGAGEYDLLRDEDREDRR